MKNQIVLLGSLLYWYARVPVDNVGGDVGELVDGGDGQHHHGGGHLPGS